MQRSRDARVSGTAPATTMRAVAVIIALVDVALLAHGFPWQLVVVFALAGGAVIAAAYRASRRAQTFAEMVVIAFIAIFVYAVTIVALSAVTAD